MLIPEDGAKARLPKTEYKSLNGEKFTLETKKRKIIFIGKYMVYSGL